MLKNSDVNTWRQTLVEAVQRDLVADDLAAGRLVVPFDLSVCDPLDFAYHVVVPKRTADLPKVVAFKTWLLDEIART